MPTKPKSHAQRLKETQRKAHSPDRDRLSAHRRGYGHTWRKARKAYLAKHPLCRMCQEQGRDEPATVVDHIRPHKGDMALFWDSSNWQQLCKAHHDAKTAKEDGGFGR